MIGDLPPQTNVEDKFEEWNIELVQERWRKLDATRLYRILNHEKNPIADYMNDLVNFRKMVFSSHLPIRIKSNCKSVVGERQLSGKLRYLFSSLPASIWKVRSIMRFKFLLKELWADLYSQFHQILWVLYRVRLLSSKWMKWHLFHFCLTKHHKRGNSVKTLMT